MIGCSTSLHRNYAGVIFDVSTVHRFADTVDEVLLSAMEDDVDGLYPTRPSSTLRYHQCTQKACCTSYAVFYEIINETSTRSAA